MKLLAVFILAVSLLAGQAPAEPVLKPAAPASTSISDKQRGDYWFTRYKASQNELAAAKAKLAAIEKLIADGLEAEKDAVGKDILKSCPTAKLDSSGDIICPK